MITCSRCGKENQKHYKFCLGCGAKLEAPAAAAPAAAPAAVAPAVDNARPAEPARAVDSPIVAAVPRMSGGMAAVAAAPVPAPVAELPATAESPVLAAAPAARASAGMNAVGAVAVAPLADAAPMPAPARETVPCPKCGKPVVATYAFCGACGYRMKVAAAAPVPAARPAVAPSTGNAARGAPRGHLTLIRPDGTEGGVHPLQDGENLIGRGQGSLFDADPYLSPRHAEFAFTPEGLVVRDLRSLNGVFVKIVAEEPLESGDILRIGQELLRFDVISAPSPLEDGTEMIGTPNPGYWGRVSVIVGRDVEGPAFPLYDETVVLGRERGDILFPEDGYVSGRHAQITFRDGSATLSDLGSSNGTFFRIRGSRTVPPGTLLLMGQQLFRASYR